MVCGVLLLQFSERFNEVKEAARLAREKSQEKMEMNNPGLSIAAPQVRGPNEGDGDDWDNHEHGDLWLLLN